MSSIATDGDSYFVVWDDRRRSPSQHIYGTRVSAEGEILDPAGIPFGRGSDPSVAATGRGYVVAWYAYNGYYAATVVNGAVQVARIGNLNGGCGRPEVASNGNTILVATCGPDVFLLDLDLHLLKQLTLATTMRSGGGVAVTAIGDEYLIVVTPDAFASPVVTQKVDAAGNLEAAKPVPGSQDADSVGLASNGTEALAVWRDRSNLTGRIIARDGSSGTPRTAGIADLTLPHPDRALYSPAVAWRGSEYVMMYMRGGYDLPRQLFLARLDATGAPAGTPVLIANGVFPSTDIAVKSDGSGAAAWLDENRSVRVGFFDDASIATATPFHKIIHAASGAHEQLLPAAERVGAHAVMAWLDRSVGTSNIRLARPGMAPLLVASNTDAHWLDVLYDGSTVWVAWAGNGKLGVRRYTPDLGPIDVQPRLLAPPAGAVVAVAGAAGGGSLAVVWRTAPLDHSNSDLVASVLRADRTTRTLTISGQTDGTEDSPVAVWDGSRFFVAWRYNVTNMGSPPFPGPAPIRALHVTAAGDPVEGAPIELHVSDTFTNALEAAPSPQGVVLAWDEITNNLSTITRVARYTGERRLNPSTLPPARHFLADIAALPNGEVDVYWWTRDFETATIHYERLSPALESQGHPFMTSPFPVSNQRVELAATATGTAPLVVHTQVDESAEATGISRLFVRQSAVPRRRAVR